MAAHACVSPFSFTVFANGVAVELGKQLIARKADAVV
jgi:hypothetical protein